MNYQFQSSQALLKLCNKYKTTISDIVIRREIALTSKNRAQIRNQMKKVRETMCEAIKIGIKDNKKTKFCAVGGDAKKIYDNSKKMSKWLSSKVAARAMAYALAVTEQNARMGKIAAFPTAGASGVVPGVLFSVAKHMKSSKRKMLGALFTASAIGITILEKGGSLAGAKAGCMAEVGTATAMAAAGATEMRGGTPEQCLNAAALALKNSLGLACDPLGGLVEVPCVKRNAIFANMAIGASDLSLMGVESFVSFDEVIDAMINIGSRMSISIRETALGGLAVTKTGMKIRQKMGLPPLPKKYAVNKCSNCKKR